MATAPLLNHRMHSLLLHESARAPSALDTVRWMGALQAQDYESGLWAVGVRTRSTTRAEVEQAIAQREIVRTWSMRGTWHLVPAADACWMQDLLASRQLPALRRRSMELGFYDTTVGRARKAVETALAGERVLPRPELIRRIAEAGCSTDDQRGNHLLRRFGNEGLLCSAVPAGKEVTFALRDEWIVGAAELAGEAALAELALRYFRSHGPATAHDLAWWSGLPLGEVRTAIAAAGKALVRHDLDESERWILAGGEPRPPVCPAELLPAFDEHLLGYQDRSAVLDASFADAVCPGGNGMFRPTLVLRGQVAGLWKKKETAKRIIIEVSLRTAPTPAARRAVEKCIPRLEHFHAKPVTVCFT